MIDPTLQFDSYQSFYTFLHKNISNNLHIDTLLPAFDIDFLLEHHKLHMFFLSVLFAEYIVVAEALPSICNRILQIESTEYNRAKSQRSRLSDNIEQPAINPPVFQRF